MNYPYNTVYPWNDFFHHYMQQHAILSYHFQKLHENIGSECFGSCNCNPVNIYNPGNYESPSSCHYSSSPSNSSSKRKSSNTSSSDYEEEYFEKGGDQYDDDEEEDGSESEYEFNVDAILAMRAAKEELKKQASSSESDRSDSIVLVESDKEDFEFIELGSLKTLESKLARGLYGCNKKEEKETQKEIMKYLYGDKSTSIAGLETAMSLNFERLCDNHQPSLWPVLPLRL